MMFSFRPISSSRAPRIAASVRIRVVSWNDAAEKNDRVDSEAKEGVYRLLRDRFDPIEGGHLRLDASDAPVDALVDAALAWLDEQDGGG